MTSHIKAYPVLVSLVSAVALAGCVSQGEYDALQLKNQDLQQQVSSRDAEIARLQGAIKYTVNSDLLFSPGSWQMTDDGKDTIAKMAKMLAPTQRNRIVVNGYTDNTPVGAALKAKGVASNDDLSQKRAESVMQYLVSQGFNPSLISAHGYGEKDPVASNSTAQGRAQNRRVELTGGGS